MPLLKRIAEKHHKKYADNNLTQQPAKTAISRHTLTHEKEKDKIEREAVTVRDRDTDKEVSEKYTEKRSKGSKRGGKEETHTQK